MSEARAEFHDEPAEWGTPEFELRGHPSSVVRVVTLVVCAVLLMAALGGAMTLIVAVVHLARLFAGQQVGRGGVWAFVILFVWGTFLGVGCSLLSRYVWKRSRRDRLRVFACGFEIIRKHDSHRVRWTDVESVREKVIAGGAGDPLALIVVLIAKAFGTLEPSRTLTLEMESGERLVFDNRFERIGQFSERARNEITARLLPKVFQRCQAGETIEFGPVTVSLRELSVDTKTVRFDEIRRIAIESGSLSVWKKGVMFRWARIEPAKIPNFDTLTGLLAALGHLERADFGRAQPS